jgi:hypothetical protein
LPQIQVWINNDKPENVEKLVKTLNEAMVANKNKKLKIFAIFLDGSKEKMEPMLTKLAEKAKAPDMSLTYISPKDDAIKAYKINLDPEVKNTVLLYRDRTVTANIVNLVADEKGLDALSKSITDLVK